MSEQEEGRRKEKEGRRRKERKKEGRKEGRKEKEEARRRDGLILMTAYLSKAITNTNI